MIGRSDDFEEEYRWRLLPHRASNILLFGILGLAFFWIPPLGLLFGIMARRMGTNDLYKMARGSMDPTGRSMTTAGMYCGFSAVCLVSVYLTLACLVRMMMGRF